MSKALSFKEFSQIVNYISDERSTIKDKAATEPGSKKLVTFICTEK